MKALVRDSLASLLYAVGLTTPRRSEALHVATFHRVLPPHELADYPLPQLVVTPDELGWFLDFFTRHFDCGPLDTICERWKSGRGFARPLLAITFDDGQGDNFLHARPVLDRARVRGTFFVPTEAVQHQKLLWHDRVAYVVRAWLRTRPERAERAGTDLGVAAATPRPALPGEIVERLKRVPDTVREHWIAEQVAALGAEPFPAWDRMMTFDEISKLASEEHEIGSHSHTHPILTSLDDAKLAAEFTTSRRVLEAQLGRPPSSFCYPNGDADERVSRAASSGGYLRAVTTAWGANAPGADAFRLRRFDMQGATARTRRGALSPARVALRMSRFQPRPR
jgi:peptidoglycan/xylan/chitin deacetylase (PgdA/CDA1 family)